MSEQKSGPLIKFKRLFADAKVPVRKEGDSDWDLFFYSNEPKTIQPHTVESFRTGVAFEIPPGYSGKIEERSSMGKKNLAVRGGVIDRSYRGEIIVLLSNLNDHPVTIEPQQKFAQIGFKAIYEGSMMEVDELSATSRGAKGFGSSGQF